MNCMVIYSYILNIGKNYQFLEEKFTLRKFKIEYTIRYDGVHNRLGADCMSFSEYQKMRQSFTNIFTLTIVQSKRVRIIDFQLIVLKLVNYHRPCLLKFVNHLFFNRNQLKVLSRRHPFNVYFYSPNTLMIKLNDLYPVYGQFKSMVDMSLTL